MTDEKPETVEVQKKDARAALTFLRELSRDAIKQLEKLPHKDVDGLIAQVSDATDEFAAVIGLDINSFCMDCGGPIFDGDRYTWSDEGEICTDCLDPDHAVPPEGEEAPA